MWIATLGLAACPHIAPDDLSRCAPEGTLAWFQTVEHAELLTQGLDHPFVARVLDHPLVRADLEKNGQDPRAILAFLEAVLGVSPLELADELSRNGIGVGLLPGEEGEPQVFVATRGTNPGAMEDAIDIVVATSASFGGAKPLPGHERGKLGASVVGSWSIGPDGVVAALTDSGTLYAAPTLDDLRRVTRGAGRAIDLREARRALGKSATFAWLDLAALEEGGRIDDLREASRKPATHFLLGPVLAYAFTAESIGLAIERRPTGVTIRSRAIGQDAEAGATTFPASDAPPVPRLRPSADEVARAVLHRDVATLLAERARVFPPRAQPAIAEGLAGFALLVGGADAVDELFSELEPEMLVVAETVPFAEGASPDVALPAACLVARVRNARLNGPRVVGAFQSLIALHNVQRAQEGQPGLVLGLAAVEGTTMTLAHLPPPAEASGIDLAYNLAPGCAVVGDAVVLGTHHALVERVATRLARGEARGLTSEAVDRLWMRARALEALVRENRDLLALQAVLEEGKSESRAEAEIDLFIDLLGALETIELSTRGGADRPLEAELHVEYSR